MRRRTLVLVVTVLVAAGCGGARHAATPEPPKLPRTLAQSWAQQADSVAAAIDAGDGCAAQQQAITLQIQVVQASNAHQVPRPFVAQLVAAANDLVSRIACTPVVTTNGKNGKHDKHGGDNGGGGGD